MGVPRKFAAALAGAAVLLPVAGCSSTPPPAAGKIPQSASPTPATPTEKPPGHPFTGMPYSGEADPVLAVKIENTSAGKPQMGLRSADIIYVTQVEGGLTRLIAVYSSKLPKKLGPVRSARITDLHLLAQFGRPAFSYSGVQTKMIPFVRAASLVDVADGVAPSAYFREPGRYAPYNLFATPKKLLAAAPKATKAKDIGFVFSDTPPEGGTPRKTYSVRYPAARFTFGWSENQKRWLVWQDGKRDVAAEGGQQGAPTIVVQYAKTGRSQFHDVNDSYTPLVQTVGKGRAVVLRDGQAFEARWSRKNEKSGTEFTTKEGEPMPFAPGQVWVVLAAPKPIQP
ncbi:DUF3048 domain-containing protein [Sinosporangium siamense]|uniref:DUF3048 domain-containing protein n=1 Tax=Sinosporangium siamense TaxID=1367973 RepID=A0A919RNB3_9ACTN|nr:DUF3048 domain-containing protein [Sinosporangium siamense]GII95351.1 hypothetical protein Ssi02_55820 [Sinosporangium siamense]